MTYLIPYWNQKGLDLGVCRAIPGFPNNCEGLQDLVGLNVHPTGLLNPCCYITDSDGTIGHIEEGILKTTSLSRVHEMEKRFLPTHCNVEERVRKVGTWSCFECMLNFQIHIKGIEELKRS